MLANFEFNIDGPNVRPDTVRARELLSLLMKLESALSVTARSSGAGDESLHISLVDVRGGNGASAYGDKAIFAADEAMTRAAKKVSDAINDQDSSLIPPQAVFTLLDMHKAASKRDWSIGLRNGTFAAIMEPHKDVFRDAVFRGKTSIFAHLTSVGGRKPTAHIRLQGGQKITADVQTVALAQRLGAYLYRDMVLIGEAAWSVKDMSIRKFRIEAIGSYDADNADPLGAFEEIRKITGDVWQGVDPDEYINDLRKE